MAWPECTPPNPFLNIRLPRMGFWERPSTSTPTAPLYAMTLASPGWIPPTVWPPVLTSTPMSRLPRFLVRGLVGADEVALEAWRRAHRG